MYSVLNMLLLSNYYRQLETKDKSEVSGIQIKTEIINKEIAIEIISTFV